MPMYGLFQFALVSRVFAAAILEMAGAAHAPVWKRDPIQVRLGVGFESGGVLDVHPE